MKLLPSFSFLARALLAGALVAPPLLVTSALAQQPAATLDKQDFDGAMAAQDAGKLEEAAGLLEGIPVKYPTSPYIPQATVRLGYVYFRLQQYDKAVKALAGIGLLKNVPPDINELAASLTPQVLAAKAMAGGPKDPQRKRNFDEAIKGYDAFLQKYPASEEVESANYGKAVALYQTERFDEARASLFLNLSKFPKSQSVLDSQYLMALTLGTIANNAAAKDAPPDAKPDPSIATNYDNAEKMLADIVAKGTDVALANDSRFQIAELVYSRAGFTKDEKMRTALFQRALEIYRVVGGKDVVVAAQTSRVEQAKALLNPAQRSGDQVQVKRVQRFIEREQDKLESIKARPDQTIVAKIKMAEVFTQLDRLDEARLVLNYVKPMVEDPEQKKTVDYQIALSLARQNADAKAANPKLAGRTEAAYADFEKAYGNDPIGENLPLLLGAAFANRDTAKANKYFDDLKKNFPGSKLQNLASVTMGSVLIQDEKYDEAMKVYEEALAKNLPRDLAAQAKFGKATVLQKQKKLKEALPIFKDVRDNYVGTAEATNASFYYPQLMLEDGDVKGALPELQAFVKNNPTNKLLPTALFFLAQAQSLSKQTKEALATYKRIADEFPGDTVAPFTYFSRAQILMAQEGKTAEVIDLMHEFMKKYPDKETLFQAYDFVAQIQVSEKNKDQAAATYEEFATLKPADPMAAQAWLRVATLSKEQADEMGRYLALKEEQRPDWVKAIDHSVSAAEKVVRQYPESPQVALALALLLDDYKLRFTSKLIAEADIEQYFQKLSEEFNDKPSTRSKVVFTLAGNLMEKNKEKAMKLMAGVYDKNLKYAPEDMDLYGTGLIEQKKQDEAVELYTKLAKDYPIPAGKEPTQATRDLQEAQSMALFGLGKVLQDQGKIAEAKVKFDELEKDYGWSPKMLAAHYGIAAALFLEHKNDAALERLLKVIRAPKAPSELRARAMLLLAQIHEENKNYDEAINNYIKISAFYAGVPKVAAEGLWRGAQLLEKQSLGQIPIPTPPPKATPMKKTASPAPAAGAAGSAADLAAAAPAGTSVEPAK